MAADVSFAQCAEDCVDQGVEHGVRIGMADESAVVGNLNAAEYKFSPAAKTMHVETMSDANVLCHHLPVIPRHHHPKTTNNQQRPSMAVITFLECSVAQGPAL